MKMVKSLLLGSAAGVVAVAGAQAADLPVKAKAVEYVKICSLYGAGFYYIPGTDICMKVGGYVRYETFWNFGSNGTTGPWVATGARLNPTAATNFSSANVGNAYNAGENTLTSGSGDYVTRVRAYAAFDTRQQTQYGTLRTFLNLGVNVDSPANQGLLAQSAGGLSVNRAFIQFAGFTIGLAQSYYDFYSAPATGYFAPPSSDTGDGGQRVVAYTAQFGGGGSASISAEDPRRSSIFNVSSALPNSSTSAAEPTLLTAIGLLPGPSSTNAARKVMMPDIVGNLRLDQTWGAIQLMAALHDTSPGYQAGGIIHEGTKFGYALGAGLRINAPMFGAGDYLQTQFNYTVGASKYSAVSLGSASAFTRNGQSFGYGVMSDGIFDGNAAVLGSLQLTTTWGVNAAYEHFWTPALQTSVYGSYMRVSYNSTANSLLCNFFTTAINAAATNTSVMSGCANNNYNWWTLGSRTQWNIVRNFYMGLDVIYMKLNTANAGATVAVNAAGAMSAGTYTVSDQSIWALRWRVHRDIVP